MSVASRLARLEKNVPWAGESEAERWQRLMGEDAECVDLSIRIHKDREKRFKGMDLEAYQRSWPGDPLQAALYARLTQRRDELLSGAPPSRESETERYLKRIHGELPPGMVLP
ncbi:MAG: hypothetical protein IT437_13060 [Phycisphaerales bacterium]|nr:hypothetical protein [Phycisphaerales bacterium]